MGETNSNFSLEIFLNLSVSFCSVWMACKYLMSFKKLCHYERRLVKIESYSRKKLFWCYSSYTEIMNNSASKCLLNNVVAFDGLGKWYQYWEKICIEIRSYFYNQEDTMINLRSLMNVFGKRSYLQGIFTYNILLKRAFLKKFSDRDENF